ncbi:hypothetical protein RB623_19620 [Mesorhizobium sp. LHD-90]|uniref:hypothetical protein n=1 Tax=Mesorhizobium sp. LHD-90 TaxID=3071414 RepID=UPI0027E0F50D|nr:hypothetical protein [Mesorhizobium sp. LHD-90]MDQ6436273.1 hypothetical protein [Mesorhizobium sp. LHD-90]
MTTVLITGARAPVALHWSRVLHEAGHKVVLADSNRFPMSRSNRFKAAYLRLPPPRGNVAAYAKAVEAAVRKFGCNLVVPTCEEVFFLAAARDLHGAAIPLFAPPFGLLKQVHNKFAFSRMAQGLGADPPPTALLSRPSDLDAWEACSGDFVFKPVWSRFAERVLIRPDWTALQRIVPSPDDPWVAQEYLPGEELCAWALAHAGRLLALQAYRPLYRAGRGAALAFEPVAVSAIENFVSAFTASTQWTGQISFDFRRDADGRLSVIECNPRATSGLHFFGAADGLADALLSGRPAQASGTGQMTLPLAMFFYGLPDALRNGASRRWWRDFRAMADISRWPKDRYLLPAQFLALAEIGAIAATRGIGLKAAATADIEWNGEALDPV